MVGKSQAPQPVRNSAGVPKPAVRHPGQGGHKARKAEVTKPLQLQLDSPETCIMAPMLATFSVALGSHPAMKIVNSSAHWVRGGRMGGRRMRQGQGG